MRKVYLDEEQELSICLKDEDFEDCTEIKLKSNDEFKPYKMIGLPFGTYILIPKENFKKV